MNKPSKITPPMVTAEELDRRFDDGEDVLDYFDLSRASRPGLEKRRVNLDFPDWMVRSLDVQAKKRGVTRQALIKMWLADRLEAAG
jgi:CopG antitoxin of type II toxin-antitoxin system